VSAQFYALTALSSGKAFWLHSMGDWVGFAQSQRHRLHCNHNHKHQGLGHSIRPFSSVTAVFTNVSSVFQSFSFPVVCSGMISKGFGFVAIFVSVEASSVYLV
jgi:hypothetical protein